MADKILGKDAEKKLAAVPLSNNINTIQRRHQKSDNAANQKCSIWFFAILLDESTNISSYAQLIVFLKYVCNSAFKEEFFLQLSRNE